jgi:hypothetical protein
MSDSKSNEDQIPVDRNFPVDTIPFAFFAPDQDGVRRFFQVVLPVSLQNFSIVLRNAYDVDRNVLIARSFVLALFTANDFVGAVDRDVFHSLIVRYLGGEQIYTDVVDLISSNGGDGRIMEMEESSDETEQPEEDGNMEESSDETEQPEEDGNMEESSDETEQPEEDGNMEISAPSAPSSYHNFGIDMLTERAISEFGDATDPVYTEFYAGTGFMIIARRAGIDSPVEFMDYSSTETSLPDFQNRIDQFLNSAREIVARDVVLRH